MGKNESDCSFIDSVIVMNCGKAISFCTIINLCRHLVARMNKEAN